MAIVKSIQKRAEKFEGLAKATHRLPSVENVHDLRILTRKLRSDLWVVPKNKRTEAMRAARKELKALGDVLGNQRMYDVAIADAHRYHRKSARLYKALLPAQNKVRLFLEKKHRRRIVKTLKAACKDFSEVAPEVFAPRLELLRKRIERAKKSILRSAQSKHRLRVDVKKARYLLEDLDRKTPALKVFQDKLGEWHDLVVLSELSGHPKELDEKGEVLWKKSARSLKPALAQASRALHLAARDCAA